MGTPCRITLLQKFNPKTVNQHKPDTFCSNVLTTVQQCSQGALERRKHSANVLPWDVVMAERKQEAVLTEGLIWSYTIINLNRRKNQAIRLKGKKIISRCPCLSQWQKPSRKFRLGDYRLILSLCYVHYPRKKYFSLSIALIFLWFATYLWFGQFKQNILSNMAFMFAKQ